MSSTYLDRDVMAARAKVVVVRAQILRINLHICLHFGVVYSQDEGCANSHANFETIFTNKCCCCLVMSKCFTCCNISICFYFAVYLFLGLRFWVLLTLLI